MKLFYMPAACSLASHIVLREAGLSFEAVKVNTKEGKTADGADFKAINPKGYVPALQLDNGEVLTEGVAIMQYIADQAPAKKLAPAPGTFERARLQEWLHYIGSEIHKGYGVLWKPNVPDEWKQVQKEGLFARFDWLDQQLASKTFLMGDQFTVADAYLFTVLNWTGFLGIDLAKWPALKSFQGRVFERPTVIEAMKAEGLLK